MQPAGNVILHNYNGDKNTGYWKVPVYKHEDVVSKTALLGATGEKKKLGEVERS